MVPLSVDGAVLVVNAGSSSLKLALVGTRDDVLARATPEPAELVSAVRLMADQAATTGTAVSAVGHRIVHGGTQFRGPAVMDEQAERQIADLARLAPLHQSAALDAARRVRDVLPGVPAVACFDTVFHAGLPDPAATYALPPEWRQRWGLRRLGFHGLSYAWAARRTPQILGAPVPRLVVAHLGAGASACAIRDGTSVDTTMGFTPLEGLVMATRSGSIDPGIVGFLAAEGVPVGEIMAGLEYRSGLLGLAGTSDMAIVVERATRDDVARLTLEVFLHRLRAAIAAMAAALGGLDALAFTGGIGQNSPEVRGRAARGLEFLGIGVDPSANRRATTDAEITSAGRPVRTVVVEAREDLQIATEVRGVLNASRPRVGRPTRAR